MATLDARTAKVAPVERIRGRKGVEIRARNLARDPLCKHCGERGIVRLAMIVDHVVPLWKGGPDTDENKQSLCFDCHDAKTASEAAERLAEPTAR